MIRKVDHIAMCVPDVDEMAEFFKKMGFEEVRRTDHHGASVEVRLPGENQVVFEFTKLGTTEVPGVNHVAFQVDDCQAVVSQLKVEGIMFDSEAHLVQASGRVIASFRDHHGFRFQVTE